MVNINTKVLFKFDIQSMTDVITNSSSELFVFKNRELDDLILIISTIHPCWDLEYYKPVQVNKMEDRDLISYLETVYGGDDYSYDVRYDPVTKETTNRTNVARHFGLKPELVYKNYENWNPDEERFNRLEYLLQQDLDWGKIAFGAHFYNSLLNQNKIKCYLYPPESLSKNLLLDDTIKVTPSSFDLNPIKEIKYEYM